MVTVKLCAGVWPCWVRFQGLRRARHDGGDGKRARQSGEDVPDARAPVTGVDGDFFMAGAAALDGGFLV